MDNNLRKELGIDEYLELLKEDKNLDDAYISFGQYIYILEKENQNLKENLKATSKGLNKVLLRSRKWKDRYYKERLNKRNLIKYLESLLTGKVEIDNFIKIGVLNLLERVRNNNGEMIKSEKNKM